MTTRTPIQFPRMFRIRSMFEYDDEDESYLYWNKEVGWSSFEDSTWFSPEERHSTVLPLGGQWEEITRYSTTGVEL